MSILLKIEKKFLNDYLDPVTFMITCEYRYACNFVNLLIIPKLQGKHISLEKEEIDEKPLFVNSRSRLVKSVLFYKL